MELHSNRWRVAVIVLALFGYALVLEKLGFLISTFLLTTVLFKVAGVKRWHFTFLGSALTVVVTYFLFTYLGLSFPYGIADWR